MLPTDKVKVYTKLPPEAILEPFSTIYEDRYPSLPWHTEDPELLARMTWHDFCPHNGAAVLGSVQHYFGHHILVLQWWRIPENIKGENIKNEQT